jgi:tryptophan halogenase
LTDRRIRRIAIVGGGSAGWSAAATLARRLGGSCSIHVVDSADAPTQGIGEATQPLYLELLRFLGIDQNDFIDKTQATYRLGSRLVDWAGPGHASWHPFGAFGALIERRPFYHFWHKARALGLKPRAELFSLECAMAAAGRFIFPTNALGVAQHMRYGLHVDGGMAARYLRSQAERAGVIRHERKVVSATRREDGCIGELAFEDGGTLGADLFIDCSGPRARLIGEVMEVPFRDSKQWLPCDRLLAAPVALEEARVPCTRVTARAAGWQWRMPLQQRASVGQVYASEFQSDEDARRELAETAGPAVGEARLEAFVNGRREQSWIKNVVAVGAAAGYLEPLSGTDAHLVSNAISNLLDAFPDRDFNAANIQGFNAMIADDFDSIRDFLILHYALARRDDSVFWQQRSQVALPDSLAQRIETYRATGRIIQRRPELFTDLDWFWIFEGSGVVPRDYDPLVDNIDFEQVKRAMLAISQKIAADVGAAPSHDSFFAAANARLAGARKAAAAANAPPATATPPAT